ncbi:MAG: alkene reductase [Bacteroidales bacterium]|nr:alkene reductase [Bacteroidales bacterium]MCF8403810.1 alkene reductase [Bacteroidales bacterium]
MNKSAHLFKPLKIGRYELRNRVIMAPLTRRRATTDHIPTEIMATYYQQRASAGLIIAEATNISAQAVGYMNSPGIYNDIQIEAWKKVTKGVHKSGGLIFLQLWHTGRISHSLLQPNNNIPVSASSIKANGQINTPQGQMEMEVPRTLEIKEISRIIEDYKQAAINSIEAGFDGIEIHAANGYLPDQFLHDGSNHRKDIYGGSIANRCRFVLEVVEACCTVIGSDRVGIRLSPSGIYKDMMDSNPVALYEYLINYLNDFNLAYLHLMEPYVALDPPGKYSNYLKKVTPHFRKVYSGKLITNVNFNFESGNMAISSGVADAIAYGKLFISNPDLVERFKKSTSLNTWDENTFYYGGEKGYLDYPSH